MLFPAKDRCENKFGISASLKVRRVCKVSQFLSRIVTRATDSIYCTVLVFWRNSEAEAAYERRQWIRRTWKHIKPWCVERHLSDSGERKRGRQFVKPQKCGKEVPIGDESRIYGPQIRTGSPKWAETGFCWLGFRVLHCLSDSAWADGNLAEAAAQGSWVRWWNTEIKVNPTQASAHLGHPVHPAIFGFF